jgi:myo-inositol 2-dehydrogenase/D-chiro-inositol 1-dehydrogenase
MNKTKIRVGLIGTGGMGGRHARNLTQYVPGSQVVAVMDIDRERATRVAGECGQAQVYSDASALIADPEVDAVVIVSPDATHAPLTLECLAAGKAVLVEKPLATTVAEAKQVLEAEVAAGRRLVQVGFMREYDPAHVRVKQVLQGGNIGRPLMFRGVHNNLSRGAVRLAREVIVSSAIHDVHSARWLMGDEVDRVHVTWVPSDPAQPQSCRLLLVQLTFRNGALGLIECNIDSGYGYEVLVEITGEKGQSRSLSLQSPLIRGPGMAGQAVEVDWLERFETAYIREAQAWIASLLAGKPAGPSTWDGYISMIVAEACIHSVQTGQPQPVPALDRPALYR